MAGVPAAAASPQKACPTATAARACCCETAQLFNRRLCFLSARSNECNKSKYVETRLMHVAACSAAQEHTGAQVGAEQHTAQGNLTGRLQKKLRRDRPCAHIGQAGPERKGSGCASAAGG